MRDFDWISLLEKRLEAPYKPQALADNFDKIQANNDAGWKNDDEESLAENNLLIQRNSIQALFDGYHYFPIGGGQPIPFTLDSKDSKPVVPTKVVRVKAASIGFRTNIDQNKIEFNTNQPIRIIDNSRNIKGQEIKPAVEPTKPKLLNYSVNFGFSRRKRDSLGGQKDGDSTMLDQSIMHKPVKVNHSFANNSFVQLQSQNESLFVEPKAKPNEEQKE